MYLFLLDTVPSLSGTLANRTKPRYKQILPKSLPALLAKEMILRKVNAAKIFVTPNDIMNCQLQPKDVLHSGFLADLETFQLLHGGSDLHWLELKRKSQTVAKAITKYIKTF